LRGEWIATFHISILFKALDLSALNVRNMQTSTHMSAITIKCWHRILWCTG